MKLEQALPITVQIDRSGVNLRLASSSRFLT
jgi:hypothetical protein